MNDLPEQAFAQPVGAETAQGTDTSSPNSSTNFIRLASVNRVSQARDLKLRVDDVIVAVNGAELSLDIEQLDLLMKSTIEEDMLISIYRNGHIFEVLASGSLGCSYEYVRPDTAKKLPWYCPSMR